MRAFAGCLVLLLGAGGVAANDLPIHAFHREKLGSLDCNLCHVPAKQGSVMLQRPGHEQCVLCHDLSKDPDRKVCAECHSSVPSAGKADLLPYPRRTGTIVEFAHSKHMDAKARVGPDGLRSDCSFCHQFEKDAAFAKLPTHQECAACHAKAGYSPQLTGSMDPASCRGCHAPEEIGTQVATGQYANIKFSHAAHFKAKDRFNMNCTTCHYEVQNSKSLAAVSLPQMVDCVRCHDTSKQIAVQFRMSNCKMCHEDSNVAASAMPGNHMVNVKPDFHTESFRVRHTAEASAPDAKCFVCHLNVMPSKEAKAQCVECHQVMRPVSHTARWKEETHGKYAALDRSTCAMCHNVEYCSTCHNELPRSHVPLPLFKAGAHAQLAMLDQRSCLTCHTFQNTCASCHTSQLNVKPVIKK